MTPKERKALIDKITKEWTDRGLLIEAGFAAMHAVSFPNAPPQQVHDMRMAFFGGAQHLFGTIMNVLDPGIEPTEKDLIRMDQISCELDRFIIQFAKENLHTKGNA